MSIQKFQKSRAGSFFFVMAVAAVAALSMSGCDLARNQLKYDRERNKELQDARDMLAPRLPELNEKETADSTASIPELQPYVASAGANMKSMPLVSISVNQTVSIRDALLELAKEADYDMELDPRITGAIIFTARERPFDEVVARICDIAGLRYRFENDMLRVEVDTPYNKLYKIDYLSNIRQNKGSIRNNVAVSANEGNVDTGSSFETSSESEADFWGELEQNLDQILGGSVSGALKTKKTPKIKATEQNPQVQPTAAVDETGKPAGSDNVNVQPPQAVLNVESLPEDEEDSSGASAGQSGADNNDSGFTFTLNKQAGLVNVFASEKAHKEVADYLMHLRKAVTSQVLIEAKILEVSLTDAYASGINWQTVGTALGEFDLSFLPTTPDSNNGLVIGYSGNDFDALVEAISTFGSVKALSSPRLTVLNNQAAILNVSTNLVFFDLDVDVTRDDQGSLVTVSSDPKNIPEGVLVNVQPSINTDNGTISLALRPTVSKKVRDASDPAVAFFEIPGLENLVPEMNVQEIDSVIQVRSGQAIVMGGLIQDNTEIGESGVPVLSETPLIGNLFKRHTDEVSKVELIIFLKATILPTPGDTIDNADKDIYRAFSGDRRPFKL